MGSVIVAGIVTLAGCSASPSAPTTTGSSSARSTTSAATHSGPSEASDESTRSDDASPTSSEAPSGASSTAGVAATGTGPRYAVVSVVDGDTIKVRIDGVKTPVRLIGVDTPETHKPGAPVECFGPQASSHMQSLVQSKQVQLVADPTQGDRDHYGRLLRHVYVGGSTNVALAQIEGGYGREDTYERPYAHREAYLGAQARAQAAHRGTWGPPCNGFHAVPKASGQPSSASSSPSAAYSGTPAPHGDSSPPRPGCDIKGNISRHGDKIAHRPGTRTYAKTRIDPSEGERWFCSPAEAVSAGWRMAND